MKIAVHADALVPPRKRDREASRRLLIDAGIELFSTLGYEAATTKAIATLAGFNEQLITRYFGGKAGLLAAVYLDFIERRENDALYALEPLSHDASEEIRRFMVFKHRHIADIEKLLRIVMPQIILDPSLLPMINDPSVLRGAVVLADRLRALQATGAIRADADLRRIATLVVWQSISLSFLMRHMSGGRDGEVLRLIEIFAITLGSGLG
ncbi:MAG: transcriptional regulator [Sphingomonadales bacterium]|nr:transcriptional regulator [Sphingomonadales bacterium]